MIETFATKETQKSRACPEPRRRGGKRAGSGRKKVNTTQLTVRLPDRIIEALQPGAAAKVRELVESNFKTL
jgi:hypothetical protein